MFELKNWYISSSTPFSDNPAKILAWGDVYGNPKFEDGMRVHTPAIQDIINHEDEGFKEIVTRNSHYIVRPDTVDPRYEYACPNAYAKLKMTRGDKNEF